MEKTEEWNAKIMRESMRQRLKRCREINCIRETRSKKIIRRKRKKVEKEETVARRDSKEG